MKIYNFLGLSIVSIGGIILFSYGLYTLINELFSDSSIPDIVSWGIVLVILGFFILLISLITERIKDSKKEK